MCGCVRARCLVCVHLRAAAIESDSVGDSAAVWIPTVKLSDHDPVAYQTLRE